MPNIDKVAQAGIDVNFLSTITRYNNTFAYQGTAGSGTFIGRDGYERPCP